MFTVIDNNKPADCRMHKVDKSWDKSTYDTFEEALSYARKWLGKGHESIELELGVAYDYSGYGDEIKIIEESVKTELETKLLEACMNRVKAQDKKNEWEAKARRDKFASLKVCEDELEQVKADIDEADGAITRLSSQYYDSKKG